MTGIAGTSHGKLMGSFTIPTSVQPNKPLQRSGADKAHGRGLGGDVLEQVLRARVLKWQCLAAERGC
jgi:hypothetical protein